MLLCLGSWSLMGMVKDFDVKKIVMMEDANKKDAALPDGWDAIDDVALDRFKMM